jgi:long-chain acyl-CoA synthetase
MYISSCSIPNTKELVWVVTRGQRVTADELLAYARERLEDYKVPHRIEFRTELPKKDVGKVARGLLFK